MDCKTNEKMIADFEKELAEFVKKHNKMTPKEVEELALKHAAEAEQANI